MRDSVLKRIFRKGYAAGWKLREKYTDLYVKYHPISRNKIVLDNYGGQGYGDNPKYIAEEIHRQNLNWDMVWLTKDLNIELPPYVRPVRYWSYKAKQELSTARVVVTNKRDSMRTPKKQGQIYLQTWHGGLGFKKVEGAAEEKLNDTYLQCAKRDGAECDGIISACALQSKDYIQDFWLNDHTEILEFGQPRCDALFLQDEECVHKRVRKALRIPDDKSIILYTPTFRDAKTVDCFALDFHEILDAFAKEMHKEFVMIVRLHPNIHHLCSFLQYDDKVINGSIYPDIQELFLASDVLITDYSSAAFDFALLNKPVFLCMLDYEQYIELRGLSEVFEVCPFTKAYSNAEMIQAIKQFSQVEYMQRFNQFKTDIWKPYDDGHAAERTVAWLKRQIGAK